MYYDEAKNAILNLSEALAIKEHGSQVVISARQAFMEKAADDEEVAFLLNYGHPLNAIVEWYTTGKIPPVDVLDWRSRANLKVIK